MKPAETIFSKIIRREIPADIVYEDDLAIAFKDIAPTAPIHILVIPKEPIAQLSHVDEAQYQALMGHLLLTVKRVAEQAGLDNYRVVINNGPEAGQTVPHLHLHVLGGRQMQWPPG